jgi:transcription initiation factor IIE alpha subunit
MGVKQMIEGWRNNIIPPEKLKDVIEDTSKERMNICNNCEYISTKHTSIRLDVHCTNCGCTLSAKTKCLSCSCPLNKWKAIISYDQQKQINNE